MTKIEANAQNIVGRDTNQADAQYAERNRLDLAVPRRPLAKISYGLQKRSEHILHPSKTRKFGKYKITVGRRHPGKSSQ